VGRNARAGTRSSVRQRDRRASGPTGTPDDVATTVVLLIDSEYVTGAVIPCDGGLRLS
jgi:NAD(P)-dependent dehydrogenase (short-subunit alcohol dehydrogenase family)